MIVMTLEMLYVMPIRMFFTLECMWRTLTDIEEAISLQFVAKTINFEIVVWVTTPWYWNFVIDDRVNQEFFCRIVGAKVRASIWISVQMYFWSMKLDGFRESAVDKHFVSPCSHTQLRPSRKQIQKSHWPACLSQHRCLKPSPSPKMRQTPP